jgi:putative membrane protein
MRRKRFFLGLNGFFLLLQPWLAIAQSGQPQPYWSWPGPWHMWAGGWGFWWIFPLLMFGLLIFLCAFFVFRNPRGYGDRHSDTTGSALTILSERFAKGDISKEEFEERRAILVRRI